MKKIGCLLLAMAVGLSGILSGVTTQAAEGTAETAKYVVVLDPGHGGAESGAGAIHNGKVYREEEINWKIANYTMQALSGSQDIEVHLTKKKNQSLGLMERVNVAKRYGADLLVSQHIDDSDSSAARGASVLLSRGTYRPAIAAKEKKICRLCSGGTEQTGNQQKRSGISHERERKYISEWQSARLLWHCSAERGAEHSGCDRGARFCQQPL